MTDTLVGTCRQESIHRHSQAGWRRSVSQVCPKGNQLLKLRVRLSSSCRPTPEWPPSLLHHLGSLSGHSGYFLQSSQILLNIQDHLSISGKHWLREVEDDLCTDFTLESLPRFQGPTTESCVCQFANCHRLTDELSLNLTPFFCMRWVLKLFRILGNLAKVLKKTLTQL